MRSQAEGRTQAKDITSVFFVWLQFAGYAPPKPRHEAGPSMARINGRRPRRLLSRRPRHCLHQRQVLWASMHDAHCKLPERKARMPALRDRSHPQRQRKHAKLLRQRERGAHADCQAAPTRRQQTSLSQRWGQQRNRANVAERPVRVPRHPRDKCQRAPKP